MKHILAIASALLIIMTLSGCISMQEIKPPQTGSDQDKVKRFNAMEDHWSYLNNTWVKGERVHPEDLEAVYKISDSQAKGEIKEFVTLQRNHSGFRRFLLSIYWNQFRYYVD